MKKAFTMLELVFVIVIMGILAAVIMPNTRSNPVHEAAQQLSSHIRYVQHLAMTDDKYDAADTNWGKSRWQMVFSSVGPAVTSQYSEHLPAYTIFSDSGGYGGDASFGEIAKNPENIKQIMTGGYGSNKLDIRDNDFAGMKKMNLGKSYGISGIARTGGCVNLYQLTFDSFGRPIEGTHTGTTNTHQLITSDCNITLTDGSESVSIILSPETGFTCIMDTAGNCI